MDVFAFNGDGNPSTPDDQVRVSGNLGGGLTYDFGVDVDWGEAMNLPQAVYDCLHEFLGGGGCSLQSLLPPVQAAMQMEAQAAADLTVQGSAIGLRHGDQNPVGGSDAVHGWADLDSAGARSALRDRRRSLHEFSVQGHASASIVAGASFSTKEGVTLTPPKGDVSFAAPVVDESSARARGWPSGRG